MAGGREQMIDAAERLAARQGIGSMSLREVQAAAGQRNKSAAQYHFGSREGLIEAVITSRMGPINEQRLDMLAALPEPHELRHVVAALVTPLADATVGRSESCWARFLFQAWVDPTLERVVQRSLEASSFRSVRQLLVESVDHLPEPLRLRRVQQAVGFVVMVLASAEVTAGRGGGPGAAPGVVVSDLIDTCCGLLLAPSSSVPEVTQVGASLTAPRR
jgi:AcrR family transcriptional regulator